MPGLLNPAQKTPTPAELAFPLKSATGPPSAATLDAQAPPQQAEEERWFLSYGADMHPSALGKLLGPHQPLERVTVVVPGAFLSFDAPGVPFISPCWTSVLFLGPSNALTASEKEIEREEIWNRCCPGLEFTGDLPPFLEGLALRLSPEAFEHVFPDSINPKSGLRRIECQVFAQGDKDVVLRRLEAFVLPNPRDLSATGEGMQPSQKYLRGVIVPAYLSALSQPFLGHLMMLRPFQYSTLGARIGKAITTFVFLPPFLFITLPAHFLRLLGASRLAGWWSSAEGRWKSRSERVGRALERGARGWLGSGYRNSYERSQSREKKQE